MGLFGPKKVTADNLPTDEKKLYKKADRCYDSQDYEGAVLCYERLYEMGKLRTQMDMVERAVNRSATGESFTVAEKVILGELSPMQGLRHQMVRDAVEEKMRRKLEE